MEQLSLSAAIVKSLKSGEMCLELESALLVQDRSKARRKDETEYWDYKEELNIENPEELTKLIKYVLAFHNSQGGVLFVGISKDYKAVGVPRRQICDTNQLSQKLRSYIGTNVKLFQDQVETSNKERPIWVILIPKRDDAPQELLKASPHNNQTCLLYTSPSPRDS